MFSKEVVIKIEDVKEEIEEFISLNSSEQQNQSDFESEQESSSAQVEPSTTPAELLKRNFQAFVGSLKGLVVDHSEKDKKITELDHENARLFFRMQDEIDYSDRLDVMKLQQAAAMRALQEKLQVLEQKQREHQLDSEASIARIVHLENKAKRLKTAHQEDEKVKVTLEAKIANLETKVAHQKIAIKELASELTHSLSVSKTSSSEKADGATARRLAPASPNKLLLLSEAANRRNKAKTSSSLEIRDFSKENVRSANF